MPKNEGSKLQPPDIARDTIFACRSWVKRDNQSNEDAEGGTQDTHNSSILKDFSVLLSINFLFFMLVFQTA